MRLLRQQHHSWPALLTNVFSCWQKEGIPGVKRLLRESLLSHKIDTTDSFPNAPTQASPYDRWLAAQNSRIEQLHRQLPQLLADMVLRPCFSLVVPVFNTDPAMLEKMIASVASQLYPDWELCLADDASTAPHIRNILTAKAAAEPRIRIVWRTENGHISEATNSAVSIAYGDYVAFLDHDDELAPHALLSLAQWINQHPDSELIYSDEDKLDEYGRHVHPYFKPDWSPMLLCSQNYLGHQVCVKRTLLQQAGPFRTSMNGSQDYDMMLRLGALAKRVDHLPDILYHWRLHAGSTAINTEAKPYAHEAGRQAISEHLQARYGKQFVRVDEGEHLFTYIPRFVAPAVTISIIISSSGAGGGLQDCIGAIRAKTSWPDYEILVVTDAADSASVAMQNITCLQAPADSNLAVRNNLGARHARGSVLLFLADTSQPLADDWLERLLEIACLPDVASVAPQRLTPVGTLQYAGWVVANAQQAVPLYAGSPPSHPPGPFISSVLTRNVLANPADSLMIERHKFEQLGGFDTQESGDSAIGLGMTAHRHGWQNIYLSCVKLRHHGNATPSGIPPVAASDDPFFNKNLSIHSFAPEPLA